MPARVFVQQASKICAFYVCLSVNIVLLQCDQMTKLCFQYLAIFSIENVPNSIQIVQKWVENFALNQIRLKCIVKYLKKWWNLFTLFSCLLLCVCEREWVRNFALEREWECRCVNLVVSGVTRLDEISPLWHKFTSLRQFFDCLFLIWWNAEPTLANLWHYWADFHPCKCTNNEK